MKRIVGDFLAFAREQKLNVAPLDAPGLLAAVKGLHLAGDAAARSVALEVRATPARLEGDVSLLTSALINMVKNAVQVSGSGQVVTLTGAVRGATTSSRCSTTGRASPLSSPLASSSRSTPRVSKVPGWACLWRGS